jgi:CHAT domain-containing protein/tetratricopeptide (TPR) repeat protein
MVLTPPLAAQRGLIMKGAVLFAGRQGRWTLLTAWTILFATEENSGLAMDAAQKAEKIAEASADDARTATSLRYLAVLYERKGKYAEAEAAVQRGLALRRKTLGADDPAVADELVELARLSRKLNEGKEAEPLLDEAARIRERVFGRASAAYADVLIERAALLSSERRYTDAELLYREAIAIKLKALGVDDPDVGNALESLAASYEEQGRYEDADATCRKALEIEEKFMGGDDPIVIPTLTKLASVYEKEGKTAAAEEARQRAARVRSEVVGSFSGPEEQKQWVNVVTQSFTQFNAGEFSSETRIAKQAMQYSEARFGPEDYRVAAFLVILATQYYSGQAAFKKAEPLMNRAVRIQQKTLGTEDASLSETYFFYGNLLTSERKEREAEETYLHAIRIQERVMNIEVTEDPFMHSPRGGLANLYRSQGRYGDAEKLFRDGLDAEGKARGPEPPIAYAMAGLLTGLANVEEDEGKADEAVPLLQRALTYWDRAWGTGWIFYKRLMKSRALMELGRAYSLQEKFGDAESSYERAMKPEGWSSDAGATEARWGLAFAYRGEHKYDKAEQLLRKELQFDRQHSLNWHTDNTLKALASLYYDQDRYVDAEALQEQSLEIEQATMEAQSPYLSDSLHGLGVVSFALARPQQAENFFQRSFAILTNELQYYFSYMSEGDRLRMLGTISDRYPMYFSFVERFHSESPQLTSHMYDLLLGQKGLVVRSMESLRQKVAASGDSEALALLDDVAARRTQLSGLMNSGSLFSDAGRQKINKLKAAADEVEQKLVARSQVFAEDQKGQAATWKEVREALSANGADAAVEFVRFPYFDGKKWTDSAHYAALVITPKSETPAFVALGDAAKLEAEPIEQYKAWIAPPKQDEAGHGVPVAAPEAFFNGFWKPLESALGTAKRVYVAPDGVLNQVSFAVVPSGDGGLLSDRYELRMVNTSADLLRSAAQSRTNTAVLIGNPKFAMSEDEEQQALAELERAPSTTEPAMFASAKTGGNKWNNQLSRGLSRSEPGGDCVQSDVLPALPGTQGEISEIYSMLQKYGWSAEAPYTGSRALEEAVKRIHHPTVLHIATHGFFLSDEHRHANAKDTATRASEDPMLRSGLFFAGATRTICGSTAAANADDGVLTAYEASMLDLEGTELVVLSACETGLGTNLAGEGVFGLRRAFQEAGAGSVLMSMWQVPDEETKRLMELFYQTWLADNNKHEALRIAQHKLRDELRVEGRDRPFYWGAFVLVGP